MLIAAGLIGANSFFVAAEFALVAVDRDQLEDRASGSDRRARRSLSLVRRLSFHLSGAQLGITISSLVLGWVIEPTVGRAIRPLLERLPFVPDEPLALSVAIALFLATGLQMVLGELVPKNLAIARPLETLLPLSLPVSLYGAVFSPVIRFLNGSANWTVRRLGIEPKEELLAIRSLEELEIVIRSSGSEGTLEADAAEMLTRTIRFGRKHADDVLVARGDVAFVRADSSLADAAALSVETGHSRFPVIGEDIHDILGLIHAKDVFEVPVERRSSTVVTDVMRGAVVIPSSRSLDDLLAEMRLSGVQLVVVVDEHGSTAGIITLEDLLEEIVGEIDDEYDEPEQVPVAVQRRGVWLVDGTLHHDDLADLTSFEMPHGPYRTLAGFLLYLFERIPEVGKRVSHEGWAFEIVAMDAQRIALVRLEAPAHAAEPT